MATADGRGPLNTGTFPNLNIVPRGETEQFTGAERTAKMRELAAARRQNIRETARPADTARERARLSRLGRTHVPDTLKAIEESE